VPPRKITWRQKWQAFKSGTSSPVFSRDTRSRLDDLDLNHRVLDTFRAVTDDNVPDADVIVGTWWETTEWVAALGPSKGAKAYFIQDHEVFEYLPVERAKATYRNGFHKIVVSQWLQNVMDVEYGDADCTLVPNTINFNQFYATNRKKNQRPTVGFLYTRAPRKAVHLAIDAIIKAREINPNLRVLSFGLNEPDKSLPLPSWVEFHHDPPQDKIPILYRNCDFWLFSSYSEGFGLPIIEAMACGTPVIGTQAGAAPLYIDDQTGALVEPIADTFTEQIIRFSDMSEDEWKQKSDNAHRRVSGYTWYDASLLFEEALRNAIKKSLNS